MKSFSQAVRLRVLLIVLSATVAFLTVACGSETAPIPSAMPETPMATPVSATKPTAPTVPPAAESTATPEPLASTESPPASLPLPPSPSTAYQGSMGPPAHRVSPSVDEEIYRSDAVVRASLQSATAAVETVPGEDGDSATTYSASHELRFAVHEYLKGSGPNEILVWAPAPTNHETEGDARFEAKAALAQRNTTWDGQQGILFLLGPYIRSGATTTVYLFAIFNWQESPWDYAADNLSRAWLPIEGSTAVTSAGTEAPVPGDASFLAGLAKADPWGVVETTPESEALADLRSDILELAATLKAGENVEGYERCISGMIQSERYSRAWTYGTPEFETTIDAGSAKGTEIFGSDGLNSDTGYSRYWVSGPDAELFEPMLVDDDNAPGNGYKYSFNTARPLPAGVYQVHGNLLRYLYQPCDFVPLDNYGIWDVTAEAPSGSVHEAFFDPVAMGDAVGADRDDGVLEPTSFTVGATDVTIKEVSWESEKATVELSNNASLADHHLDVIGLDGSVALRLDFDDTTATDGNGGAKVYTWGVCTQPWVAGDLLMLRLSESGATLTGATDDDGCGG